MELRMNIRSVINIALTAVLALMMASCITFGGGEKAQELPPEVISEPTVEELPQYSLDDLFIDEDVARMETLPNGYGDYQGKVIKVSPVSGLAWGDYSKPIVFDLNEYSGKYTISVSMSVLAEQPPAQAVTGKIGWTILNGTGYDQFGDNAVPAPSGWTDLKFTQTIDMANSGERMVFLDGLNEGQGLIDLTLYIRHFKVTVERAGNFIALTFDDGPSDLTGALLDKLNELGIKATFFLVGMNIDALDPSLDADLSPSQRTEKKAQRQAVVHRMFTEGHDLANHSYSHNYLGDGRLNGMDGIDPGLYPDDIPYLEGISVREYPLSEDAIRLELERTQNAIQQAVYGDDASKFPAASRFFRMPFNSDETRAANLIRVASSLNLPIIYGIVSGDYVAGTSPETIAASIYSQRLPWGINISHDPMRNPNIISALDILVPRMQAEGYQFVTLSEMAERRGRAVNPGSVYYNFSLGL